ncbi:MAG TPA: lactonase family protein [Pseudonocardiaceae bacterium]|jgi:6-phosphogluconolactonase (cycloisomerase 2 family)|nr:lactonase family protein [Pseudonocardiaceae bacterium]
MRAFVGAYGPAGLAVVDGGTATPVAVPNASWLALSAGRLYAVNEHPAGTVTVLDAATLAVLGTASTGGDDPTHLAVHDGHVLVANYGSGSVAVLNADLDLTDLVTFPDGSHAHQVVIDPTGRWVLTVDIGGDTIRVHTLADGTLREHGRVTATGGPRHLVFHPSGHLAYAVCEYVSQVIVFGWADGVLSARQVVPTVTSAGENYPGEVVVSPDGRFVYVTNRGDDSIATLAVDGESLRLLDTVPTGGDWPRHATLDPSGLALYVANQRSGTVTWLPRDPVTGMLSPGVDSLSVPEVAMVLFR